MADCHRGLEFPVPPQLAYNDDQPGRGKGVFHSASPYQDTKIPSIISRRYHSWIEKLNWWGKVD